MILPRNARIQWRMTHGVFPSLCCVIPDFQMQDQQAAVSHILERFGKFAQSLHDLLWHWGEIYVHVAFLSRRRHWKKGWGQNTNHLCHWMPTGFFFLKWHVILLLIMLFWPIWLMLGLAALDVQDMIAYFCTWLNIEAQLIVLNQFTEWWEQNLRVGSDPNSHLVPPCGLCLCNLHIFKWLFSFWLHTHTNVCERKLNTSGGSRFHLGKIWPSYMKLSLSPWTSNHWPWYHYLCRPSHVCQHLRY